MPFYNWSQTAATNATADAAVNWAEGQAPSSVNDSARAMMASLAKWRDDTGGSLQTGGTSTAYTLTTNSVYPSTALLNGAELSFNCHATNGASPTLNVDGLGAFPITTDLTTAVPVGTMIVGSTYEVIFYSSVSKFVLKAIYGNPYNVPLAGMMDFIGSTVPNANFVFPIGQAISRTTYSALFALVSTTYGVGDGSTTFNVPDLTGRVTAMKEASATRLTSTYFVGNSTTLGAVGGDEKTALVLANIPSITSTNASQSITVSGPSTGTLMSRSISGVTSEGYQTGATNFNNTNTASFTTNNSISVAYTNGAQTNPRTVQPTMILNKILRII